MRFGQILFLAFIFFSCADKKAAPTLRAADSVDSLFKEYYAFKMRINPIESTKAGESKFNDRVENYISDPYQADLIATYNSFLNAIGGYDSTMVTPSQWISLGVMKWDCNIKLEGLKDSLVTIASPMFD